jgi:hypothetical protein
MSKRESDMLDMVPIMVLLFIVFTTCLTMGFFFIGVGIGDILFKYILNSNL